MLNIINIDPKIIGLALIEGILPSIFWLWFWLKEDNKRQEPRGILIIVFIMGMLSTICVLPIQKFIQTHVTLSELQIILFASAEEIIKYLAVLIILYRTKYTDEPIEWPIYLITVGLGFAAFENFLFLLKPLSMGQDTVGLLTGQLRFLGSTLLHAITSGIIGIALGISIYMGSFKRKIYLLIGIIFAITLHSLFNFFIIRNGGTDFLKVFGFLWVTTIVVMLLFEKVRRLN
jgi:protease PrsW